MTSRSEIQEFNRRQTSHFERPRHNPRMTPRQSAYVERQIDQVVEALDLDADTRILDVGCGMGRFTLPLRGRGLDVVGLELSSGLLEALEEHRPRWGLPPAPLYCADMSDPPAELLGRFDVVVGFFTLHHVHDLGACLHGVVRCLRSGGRVGFIEPNPLNPLFYLQITFTPGMSWKADSGIVRMRRRRMFDAMEAAALTVRCRRCFGFMPPFLAERGAWIRADGLAEKVAPLRPFLPFQLFTGVMREAVS